MTQRLRHAAVHLALAAMILRALLPAGWMPGSVETGQSFFTICSVSGPVQQADLHQVDWHQPGKSDDGQRSHEECPFAAAPHVAAPAIIAQAVLPSYFIISDVTATANAVARVSAYQPQSPRAPPIPA